jgi:hypothetical protein
MCARSVDARSAESSRYVAPAAAGVGRTRYPQPGCNNACCSRTAARRRRRTRLRMTALPTGRDTAYDTRGGSVSGPRHAALTSSTPDRARRPRARARNIARSRTRQIRRRGLRDPSSGACESPRGRPGCASGRENRGSSCASGCWAGTSSSRMASSNARGRSVGPGATARTPLCPRSWAHAGARRWTRQSTPTWRPAAKHRPQGRQQPIRGSLLGCPQRARVPLPRAAGAAGGRGSFPGFEIDQ